MQKFPKHPGSEMPDSEAKLRAIFAHSGIGIVMADLTGHVTACNPTFQQLLGYSEGELCGKSITEFIHPDEVPVVAKVLGDLAAQKRDRYRAEKRYVRKDGSIMPVRLSVSLILDEANNAQSVVAFIEDITVHKQAEEDVRTLFHAVEQSPASIVVTDTAGRIEYVNSKFTELTGYAAHEVIGRNPRILKSGEMLPDGYAKLWKTISSGKEWHGEFHNRKKNGELFWERASISPVFNGEGVITHFVAVKEDITARREAEHQLAEALDLNRRIIANAPVGIQLFEISGECVVANKAAAKAVNATVPELLKQNFRQLDSWRRSGMLSAADETLSTQLPREGEFHFVTTFGKEVWIVCRFSTIARGSKPHLLLLIEDMTERRLAEGKIREQATILDQARDAIWILNPADHRIRYWNKGAEQIYGWSADEAVGRDSIELLFKGVITPQLRDVKRIVEEHGEWKGELEEYTKRGAKVTIEAHVNRIIDRTGNESVLVIATDITKRKELENQLLRAQRLESLGTLASGIVHDLNNVLTPILFSVELLRSKISGADVQELLEALEANVHRGAKLLKQVLAFGRGIQGQQISVEPRHVLREIRQIIHDTFPKNIQFECWQAENVRPVHGDPTQIHQVLLNLCINARDAMPDGGKLSINVENAIIEPPQTGLHLEAKPGRYVAFQVADTGTGISREVQERMFEPFFTTKPAGKGTGLGLSTTLGIVRSHGGWIHCSSEIGKGTVFEIYFPAESDAAGLQIASAPSELPRGCSELLLVVDDEEEIRFVARQTLEFFGYRVLLAANGAEALAVYTARQHEIAAVITDMVMPVMDGFSLVTALKQINPNIRIIASSGVVSSACSSRDTKTGTADFLPKPYTTAALLSALDKLIKQPPG